MPLGSWVILAFAVLLAWAFVARWLLQNPREDVEAGLFWHAVRFYGKVFHRMRIDGSENIPQSRSPGPLIVVVNHASGVDPILVQAACPFEIRWIMAEDMRHPLGEWIWRWTRTIFVSREGADISGTREALRHLRAGGVLGIFPEGGIERPPGRILPFLPGVGFIVRQSRAPVLPVLVRGVPSIEPAWAALYRFSHARLEFKPIMDATRFDSEPERIAKALHDLYVRWTGWSAEDAE